MNLVENLEQGRRLIQKGKALGKNTTPIEETVKALEERLAGDIQPLRLSELVKRNIAIEIYSEPLRCSLWLCSNERMASQVRHDDPEAVCYTVDEMKEILKLNPTPEDVKRIHDIKTIFPDSCITESKLRDEIPEILR